MLFIYRLYLFFLQCGTLLEWHPLGRILSIFETPEQLHRMENVTRAGAQFY